MRMPYFFTPHSPENTQQQQDSRNLSPQVWSGKMPSSFPFLPIVGLCVTLVLSAVLVPSAAGNGPDEVDQCVSHDSPNPIATEYPNNATGTLNGTMAIIPVPLGLARRLIPSEYGILEGAYRDLMPDFPQGMYPVFFQAMHDHDIQFAAFGVSIPDFSRIGFEFPFVDILQDGYSSFKWAPSQLLSADNAMALEGSAAYGTKVMPAVFEPACDAYTVSPDGATTFRGAATGHNSSTYAELEMRPLSSGSVSPYSMEVWKNVTNQPMFANGSSCDQMIRYFNTSLTQAPFQPVPVKGLIKANLFPFAGGETLHGVYGIQLDTAFVENNYLACSSLQGYSGI